VRRGPKNYFVAVDQLQINQLRKYFTMGKKRKAGRPAQKTEAPARTKFDVEERFDDSEDEFQAGRDQILLDDGPETKRRRRVAEEGKLIDWTYNMQVGISDFLLQRRCFSLPTRKS